MAEFTVSMRVILSILSIIPLFLHSSSAGRIPAETRPSPGPQRRQADLPPFVLEYGARDCAGLGSILLTQPSPDALALFYRGLHAWRYWWPA